MPLGKHLAQLAAKGIKHATMELDGHSPVVVLFGDADQEKTADTISAFEYRDTGQVLRTSPTRFYVQENVSRPLILKQFTPTMPQRSSSATDWRRTPRMGTTRRSGAELDRDEFVRGGCKRHAAARSWPAAAAPATRGYFFEPTVVTATVPNNSKIMTEEPFGPVAPDIVTFKTFSTR